MAVTYGSGRVYIYYYVPQRETWTQHGSSYFNSSVLADRFFSGIIVNGTTYVAGWVSGGYRVWTAPAHTTVAPVENTLNVGAVPANPYIALQEIKSMNAVMAYYLHGDGSLYGRLFYNGAWSTETLLSAVAYSNFTAPFQVPVSHGNKGYLFGNTAAGSGYLIVIDINSGNVDISDVVFLVAYIFSGGPAPNPLLSGDADCDQTVSISDAVYLISYIFFGGPAPCGTWR